MTADRNGIVDPAMALLAEHMPAFAWIADEDGMLLWTNARWRTEIDPDPVGSLWTGSVVDGARIADAMRDGLATADRFATALVLAGRDGAHRRVDATLRRSGTRLVGIATDSDQPHPDGVQDAIRAEFDVLTNAMPQMVWATRADGHHDYYNRQWYRFTGVPDGSTDGVGWSEMFHPDDRERAWARWRHSLATGDPYEVEYRLRHHDGTYRWVLGRALPVRDDAGAIRRWIGTCTDIDAAKRDAERNEILSRELSHRIKNIFAVISGLVRMSARQMPETRAFADRLTARIAALGAAHDLARPHSERSQPSVGDATLHGVLRKLLSPYADDQWQVGGDDVAIDDRGATPIALAFHELATNAAKYGALSTPDGRLSIETRAHGDALTIDWREREGPMVGSPPDATGFGTRLAALSIEQQMGGSIVRDWRREGLSVTIHLPRGALVRGAV